MKLSSIIYLVIVSLLAGCQSTSSRWTHEDLDARDKFIASGEKFDWKEEVSEEGVRDDMDFLRWAFTRMYGGWAAYGPDKVLPYLEELEKIQGPLTRSAFYKEINQTKLFKKDGHIAATAPVKTVSGTVNKPSSASENKKITGEFFTMEELSWGDTPTLWLELNKYPVHVANPGWIDFLKILARKLADSPLIVFDARKNPGGRVDGAMTLVKILAGGSPIPSGGGYLMRDNIEIRTARINEAPESNVDTQLFLVDMARMYGAREVYNVPFDRKYFRERVPVGDVFHKSRVILLTGRECASACELMTYFLKDMDHVVHVGDRTAGIVHYHTPVPIVLPRSGIKLFIPTGYIWLGNDEYIENKGIEPAVKLSSQDNPLEYIRQNLDNLFDKKPMVATQ